MKKQLFGILTSFVILLITTQVARACGTVPSWKSQYEKAASNDQRLNALKFIHCEPVLKSFAENKDKEAKLMLELLEQSISDLETEKLIFNGKNDYAENLIIMNLIRFRVLEDDAWKKNGIIKGFLHQLGQRIYRTDDWMISQILELPEGSFWYNFDGMSLDPEAYASRLFRNRRLLFYS